MTQRFAVVYEASADFLIATELAHRVLQESIDWIEPGLLDDLREWVAQTPDLQRFTWTSIPALAQSHGIRVHGHFGGSPGEPDAAAARRAILFLLRAIPDLNAILLIRDQDDQPARAKGLRQARDLDRSGKPIVIGLAKIERECWVVCGFNPVDENETGRLAEEHRKLGFSPNTRSHELTASKDNQALRSPKRVLHELVQDNHDRERRCRTETPLDQLRERGKENGLADYLEEVRQRLAPLLGHVRS